MRQRTGRTSHRNPRYKLRVTERDLWILEASAKMRFATTSQLAALFFEGSRWSANKRLRKLLDSGLLNVWVRSLSEENIYSISKKGLVAIEEKNFTLSYETKIPSSLDENLSHLLAINDVRASLALSLPEVNAEILWWRSDWELRSHGRERIIPDGLFLVEWQGLKEQPYALEVDNNTRSSRNFMKKILAYGSLKFRGKGIYGVTDPIILVGCSDRKWMERYRTSITQLGRNHQIWFAAIEEIKREGATSAIWVNGSEKKRSLLELTKEG
jgi:hypothetical protein